MELGLTKRGKRGKKTLLGLSSRYTNSQSVAAANAREHAFVELAKSFSRNGLIWELLNEHPTLQVAQDWIVRHSKQGIQALDGSRL